MDSTRRNDQPKPICSRARLFMCCVLAVVVLVYLMSSNILRSRRSTVGTSTTSDIRITLPTPKLPTQTVTHPIPHHFIGDEHLAPYTLGSSATPCERPYQHEFNFHGNDTLVVIHIQKTGGSDFLRRLVTIKKEGKYLCSLPQQLLTRIERNLSLPKGGKMKVSCPRIPSAPKSAQWMISEKTMGWKCGVHTTLSEYKSCVREIDVGTGSEHSHYHYMTILRHPVLRYLSEYEHVVRGAHWSVRKKCGGQSVTDSEMPPCYPGYYNGTTWANLTLTKFMACKSNWANNRQVMWLADLELAGCFNSNFKNRSELLLASAKCNLEKLAFFGLTEYQRESGQLFEKVFNVTFAVPLAQREMTDLHSAPILQDLWRRSALYDKITSINALDMELYQHAVRLFARRVQSIGLTVDMQKVDNGIRGMNYSSINLTSKKFRRANLHLPDIT